MLKRIPVGLKGPLVAAATVFLLSAAAEAVLRAQQAALRQRVPGRQLCTVASDQPGLVYEMAKGRCGFNSQGFPDVDRSIEKEKGAFRVLVVGDSVAASQGVPREYGFPSVLERRLRNRMKRPVEVVTMAVSGYGTVEELVVFEDQGQRYEPDLVVWSYVLNDPAHPVYHDANGSLGRYHYKPRSYLVSTLLGFAFRLVELGRCPEPEFHRRLHCSRKTAIVENLSRLRELTVNRGTPVLFLIHPVFEAGIDPAMTTLADVHDELVGLAEEQGFDALDLREAHRGSDPFDIAQRTAEGALDPWHPNAKGHRLVARAVVRRLIGAHSAQHGAGATRLR